MPGFESQLPFGLPLLGSACLRWDLSDLATMTAFVNLSGRAAECSGLKQRRATGMARRSGDSVTTATSCTSGHGVSASMVIGVASSVPMTPRLTGGGLSSGGLSSTASGGSQTATRSIFCRQPALSTRSSYRFNSTISGGCKATARAICRQLTCLAVPEWWSCTDGNLTWQARRTIGRRSTRQAQVKPAALTHLPARHARARAMREPAEAAHPTTRHALARRYTSHQTPQYSTGSSQTGSTHTSHGQTSSSDAISSWSNSEQRCDMRHATYDRHATCYMRHATMAGWLATCHAARASGPANQQLHSPLSREG